MNDFESRAQAPNGQNASPAGGEMGARRCLDSLYRIGEVFSAEVDLAQLLEIIMAESRALLQAEGSSLLLYDPEKNDLYFEVALGEAGEKVKQIRLALGEGIAGACAKDRKTLIIADAAADARHSKRADSASKFSTRNLIATPLVSRGAKLIGVLEVVNALGREGFTREDAQILEIFSDQAALAIDNARLLADNLRNERLAAIGVAVAGISHYVKNIIAAMSGSASLIEMGIERKELEMIQECWPVFDRSRRKIERLVLDMLTYSKERQPNLQPGDFNGLLQEIIGDCAAQAAEEGIELEFEPDPALPPALFDPISLHDCLLNLTSNAMDACKAVCERRVTLRTRFAKQEPPSIIIEVEDTGMGIAEEHLERIFDPFFSTKGSKGTGLGLAVVKKIVTEHGGQIAVESAQGEGARFILTLPIRPIEEYKGGVADSL